jgi:CRISPR-associated endonuclease/helicase Cas3
VTYAKVDAKLIEFTLPLAAEYHDVGKLDEQNQHILAGSKKSRHLPIQHCDAGTAYLLDRVSAPTAAVLVKSHHIGLPDFIEEINRADRAFRDEEVLDRVNHFLDELIELHNDCCRGINTIQKTDSRIEGNPSIFFRIALSCLVDADHTDAAGKSHEENVALELLPDQRLAALDNYVSKLQRNDDRSRLRRRVYECCRDALVDDKDIVACDSPVGSGKTTAVMANLLSQANRRGLRRIFVVLPFTNIITQSVKVYREALTLTGEDPQKVVAELHHRAEFQEDENRDLASRWDSPIIVTTAVAFFETLASNKPAALRRLHNLPGSAILIDESHAALPAKYLPLAWKWIKCYAKEWDCYWVLASGSLCRFWKIEEFDSSKPEISEIISDECKDQMLQYENKRISYCYIKEPMSLASLISWINSLPGPRLLIVNTVQSAAVIAREFALKLGRSKVEHISTALTPDDREKTFERINSRLKTRIDADWTLVATSCVEAGVNFSFRTGVREAASLTSTIQTGGRINRDGEYDTSEMWIIHLKDHHMLKKLPCVKDSTIVLKEFLLTNQPISPLLCTEALKREIRLSSGFEQTIMADENQMRFPQVEDKFRIIDADTRVVIVSRQLADDLENFSSINWQDIQRNSVQIWKYRLQELSVPEVEGRPHIYKWQYPYDDFIGYMAGVLSIESTQNDDFIW